MQFFFYPFVLRHINPTAMSVLTRILDKNIIRSLPRSSSLYCTTSERRNEEFLPLNLKGGKPVEGSRRKAMREEIFPSRSEQMPIDQDWGDVWQGSRSFQPSSVPLPVRQGYTKKGPSPGKYANAELMKIPNFLHLTPPAVRKHCEALKRFCTPFPEALKKEEVLQKHFPIEITSSNYCHSSPTIRDPLARIVTLTIKLSSLTLDKHANDKFRRLVGERYDEKTGNVTIVTDRCPTKQQNYDYAMYLLTALYHESWVVESWEEHKTEADMEIYDWEKNSSKKMVEQMFGKEVNKIENGRGYSLAVSALMNEGESEYTITNYGLSVRKLLNLPEKGQA